MEGNKIFAAILFAVFIMLSAAFLPKVAEELPVLLGDGHHHSDPCKSDFIEGSCGASDGAEIVVVVDPVEPLLAGVDLAVAEGLTVTACGGCHLFNEGGGTKAGPALWGIFGADIASVDGFSYSGALSGLEGVWDDQSLNQFLNAPAKWVPGTKMGYAGERNPTKRANFIAYLRSLSNDPAPLPTAEEIAAAEEAAYGTGEEDAEMAGEGDAAGS